MTHHYQYAVIVIIVALLTACSTNKKPDIERYHDMQSSFKYMAVEKLSKNTVNPGINLWNTTLRNENNSKVRKDLVHSLAAVILSFKSESTLPIAEGDLAVRYAQDDFGKYVAYSALSAAMYSNGWQDLGTEYAAKAKVLEGSRQLEQQHQEQRILAKSILGLSAIVSANGPAAEGFFSELAVKTNSDWLPITAHAAALIMDGSPIAANRQLERLKNKEQNTFAAKEKLALLQAKLESEGKSQEEARSLATKMITSATLDALKSIDASNTDQSEDPVSYTVSAVMKILALAP